MGTCYCLRSDLQKNNQKSDIDVEGNIKQNDITPPILISNDFNSQSKKSKTSESEKIRKKNLKEINEKKEKEKELIKEKEKEFIKEKSIEIYKDKEIKQLKKVDSIIEEEKKKPFNEEKEKKNEIIQKSKTIEIKELLKNKKIDLKRGDRDKNSIKIVLVGDKYVGKSSIIFQFISNKFDNFYITTIFKEDFCRKLKIGENEYNICLSSLSGDPLYKEDYNDIYEFADIFLLVFDVTNHESFNRLEDILRKDIRKYVGLIEEKQPNFFLVGNKCELKDKKVTDLEINEFCKKYNLEYFEVSAKNNRNIIKTFTRISEICDKIIHGKND